jgi:hypothetical protein
MVGTHIVHNTHTHLFMNFSKPNYTLVPTTMYQYRLKPYMGSAFLLQASHIQMPHSHTHKFFCLWSKSSSSFYVANRCLPLALVENMVYSTKKI